MNLLGFSSQNETLILDDLFYLCNVNAARLLYLYESSVGAREALKKTEKDITTCFYRLIVATPTRIRLNSALIEKMFEGTETFVIGNDSVKRCYIHGENKFLSGTKLTS